MLTQHHFEAIGRLVYESSLMELWLCTFRSRLRGDSQQEWSTSLKRFRLEKATFEELKELVNRRFDEERPKVLQYLDQAEKLHNSRNDIVHGLWQLPADVLFGQAASDIVGERSVAKAYRIPSKKGIEQYAISYTANEIFAVARNMHTLAQQFSTLHLFSDGAT